MGADDRRLAPMERAAVLVVVEEGCEITEDEIRKGRRRRRRGDVGAQEARNLAAAVAWRLCSDERVVAEIIGTHPFAVARRVRAGEVRWGEQVSIQAEIARSVASEAHEIQRQEQMDELLGYLVEMADAGEIEIVDRSQPVEQWRFRKSANARQGRKAR